MGLISLTSIMMESWIFLLRILPTNQTLCTGIRGTCGFADISWNSQLAHFSYPLGLGLHSSTWTTTAWSDIFVANGHVYPQMVLRGGVHTNSHCSFP
jgi:hypothetical protein